MDFPKVLFYKLPMLRLQAHLKNAQHVIWDWNGTLLSDVHYTMSAANRLLRARGLAEMDVERYRQVFGFPIRNYYEKIGIDLQKESFEEMCHEYVTDYMSNVFSCSLFPGAKDLLAEIKKSGRKQSILSASDQDSLDRMISHFDLHDHLDHVYGIADKMAASKVQRGRELIAASGIDPRDTLLFGDTDHDLEVGRELGVEVILLGHGHQCVNRLKEIHHTVIRLENL